jgi:hypothetical protein
MEYAYILLIDRNGVDHPIHPFTKTRKHDFFNALDFCKKQSVQAGDVEIRNLQNFVSGNPKPGEILRQISFTAISVFEK